MDILLAGRWGIWSASWKQMDTIQLWQQQQQHPLRRGQPSLRIRA